MDDKNPSNGDHLGDQQRWLRSAHRRDSCLLSKFSIQSESGKSRWKQRRWTLRRFQITEWTKKGGLVVSGRPLLEAERQRARASLSETVKSGDRLQGKVTQVKDFGIFVQLFEGVEGLMHQSEVSFNRNLKPADVVKVGDAIEVVVLH